MAYLHACQLRQAVLAVSGRAGGKALNEICFHGDVPSVFERDNRVIACQTLVLLLLPMRQRQPPPAAAEARQVVTPSLSTECRASHDDAAG